MTRHRIPAAITLLGAATATVIATGGSPSYSSAPTRAGSTVTVTGYDDTGPGGSCSGTTCQTDFPRGPSFRIPTGGSSYTAIITISMQYNTSGQGHYAFEASLWEPNGQPHDHVLPRGRRLVPSTSPLSTTLVYRVSHLVPGRRYTVRYVLDIRANGTSLRLTTHHLLAVVTARPTQRS